MAWFDRHLGGEAPKTATERLDRIVESSGIIPALDAASGPRGLRRFIVRFLVRSGAPRVVGLDAEVLPKGGGPPTPSAFDANISTVEAALRALRTNLGAWSFVRGSVGVVRDASGQIQLAFRFDEDADGFSVSDLPIPGGEAAPNEHPAYLRALSAWESRMAPVRARWILARPGERWTLAEGRLSISAAGEQRSLAATPIARWSARDGTWTWLVATPVGEEAPFVEPELVLEINGAMELAVFAAARLGRVGVFQGELDGGAEMLFAGIAE